MIAVSGYVKDFQRRKKSDIEIEGGNVRLEWGKKKKKLSPKCQGKKECLEVKPLISEHWIQLMAVLERGELLGDFLKKCSFFFLFLFSSFIGVHYRTSNLLQANKLNRTLKMVHSDELGRACSSRKPRRLHGVLETRGSEKEILPSCLVQALC